MNVNSVEKNTVNFCIPDHLWEDVSDSDEMPPESKLSAHVRINGCDMKAIAIQLKYEQRKDGSMEQVAVCEALQKEFNDIHEATGSNAPWDCTWIRGRLYGMYFYPWNNGQTHRNDQMNTNCLENSTYPKCDEEKSTMEMIHFVIYDPQQKRFEASQIPDDGVAEDTGPGTVQFSSDVLHHLVRRYPAKTASFLNAKNVDPDSDLASHLFQLEDSVEAELLEYLKERF